MWVDARVPAVPNHCRTVALLPNEDEYDPFGPISQMTSPGLLATPTPDNHPERRALQMRGIITWLKIQNI